MLRRATADAGGLEMMMSRHAALICLALLGCGAAERGGEEAPPQETAPGPTPAAGREKAPTPTPPATRSVSSPLLDFRLRLDPAAHTIHAEVQLDVQAADTIILHFRTDWAGYPGLGDRLRSLEAWSRNGALSVARGGSEEGRYSIPIGGAGRVTIAFDLELRPPTETTLYHRASQLTPEGGHLIGRDLVPRVRLGSDGGPRSQPARISFAGLPATWRVATVARRSGNAYELEEARNAVFAVGPLRTRRFNIGHRAVTLAALGDWSVPDDRIFDALRRVAGSLHGIAGPGWRDGPHLIIAGRTPPGLEGRSTGGQVVDRSGLIYVGGSWPGAMAFERWLYTAAHELMHWYIPMAFRFSERPPSWFAEGFTDYMALKAMLVAGLATPEAFLAEMGERIARYRSNPLYGSTSMAEAQSDFWEEKAYRFIYDGGASAAFLLDLGFQDRRASLEAALRGLLRAGVLDEERIVRQLSTVRENEWIREWLATGANPDWEDRLSRYELELNGSALVATDSWATEVLSSLRP